VFILDAVDLLCQYHSHWLERLVPKVTCYVSSGSYTVLTHAPRLAGSPPYISRNSLDIAGVIFK